VLLTKKRQWPRYAKRRIYKRRRRAGLFFLVFLTVLVLAGLEFYFYPDVFEGTSGEPLERVVTPTVEQAPEPIAEQKAAKGENKRAAPVVPNDPTLYLAVPKLGIYGHTVRNDDSEFALGLGAVKLPRTGFPWQKGDTNTYIACHRLGFPGTESYNQCLNLPFIQQGDEVTLADAHDADYRYRVTEMLVLGPDDG
jgi:sortase A